MRISRTYKKILNYLPNKHVFSVGNLWLEHKKDTHPERFYLQIHAIDLQPLDDSFLEIATYYNTCPPVHQTW
jgi:hypothetical protein